VPKRGLGRGLEAILGASAGSSEELREIPVGDVRANPRQPRTGFDAAKLEELAASIREHGVVQPILVRPFGDHFELVAGERRWRAAQMAGLSVVPAMVRSLSDQQSLEIALVENLQREDLNPIEEAKAYRSMVESVGLTQDEIARRIGVSRPAVSNSLRLLSLADQVQTLLEAGAITAGHARTLVGLEPQEQIRLGNEMVARGLNVRQAEQLLQRRAGQRQHAKVAVSEPDADVLAIERQLRQALGTEVRLQAKAQGKGGRLVIEYYGDEELERLIELLLRPQA